MRALSIRRSRFLAVFATAVFLAVVLWAALAGGPAEPASSGQAGIKVTSPGDVVTAEGELRRPY